MYWSSSTAANATNYAWGVDFDNGDDDNYYKSGSRYVRAVRGGQGGSFDDSVIRLFVDPGNSGAVKAALSVEGSDLGIVKNMTWANGIGVVDFYKQELKAMFDDLFINCQSCFYLTCCPYCIKQINLYDAGNKLVGHIAFRYKYEDLKNEKLITAFLRVHDDLPTNYDDYNNGIGKWTYYANKDEKPVSMLLPPPYNNGFKIDNNRQPVIFVHGVSGFYPYWDDTPQQVSELPEGYDAWQFYYPYDGEIQTSGTMLGRAISDVLAGRSFNTGPYGSQFNNRIYVIAHSMGGLVTRSYIQSNDYAQNIGKFLMLGTPNHGAFIAYRIFYKHIPDELGGLLCLTSEKDDQAPAYKQMTPGSDFLWGYETLNFNGRVAPKPLYPGAALDKTYLVIAGVKNMFMGVPHDAVRNQDDGVAALSSASLQQWGVPLVAVDFNHTELPLDLEVIFHEHFLGQDYDVSLYKGVIYVKAIWDAQGNQLTDNYPDLLG